MVAAARLHARGIPTADAIATATALICDGDERLAHIVALDIAAIEREEDAMR